MNKLYEMCARRLGLPGFEKVEDKQKGMVRDDGFRAVMFPGAYKSKGLAPLRRRTAGEALAASIVSPDHFAEKALEARRSAALKSEVVDALRKLTDEFYSQAAAQIRSGQAWNQMGSFSRLIGEYTDAALSLVNS